MSRSTMCLITSCRTRAIPASVANLVQGRSNLARISEPEDGGGNRRSIGSADCIREVKNTLDGEIDFLISEIVNKDWLMKNLIINILEAAAFLLLGLGVSLFG